MAIKKKTTSKAKTAAKKKTTSKRKAAAPKPKGLAKDLLIKVCVGNGGIAAGSQDVINEFIKELKARDIDADVAKMCVNKTGCRGFCAKDVIVEINHNGRQEVYQRITTEKVAQIVEEHIVNGEPIFNWLVG